MRLGDLAISPVVSTYAYNLNIYYMAPEVLNGKDYSFESEIWSLGVILYRLCALDYPWDKKTS